MSDELRRLRHCAAELAEARQECARAWASDIPWADDAWEVRRTWLRAANARVRDARTALIAELDALELGVLADAIRALGK